MLIAPYKVHPLWYTPILPLLFLLSAFAAGYPMVTFESIIVAKSFGRKPEMEVLTPLAKFMPVLMGLYLAVKIGDMIVRGTYVYLLDGTYQTNAFLVEVGIGVMLPLCCCCSERSAVRRDGCFFAATLFVLGILLNRINVFVVSYTPPYKIVSYFPALGEIFITVGSDCHADVHLPGVRLHFSGARGANRKKCRPPPWRCWPWPSSWLIRRVTADAPCRADRQAAPAPGGEYHPLDCRCTQTEGAQQPGDQPSTATCMNRCALCTASMPTC